MSIPDALLEITKRSRKIKMNENMAGTIKELRTRLGDSQQAFATRLGLSISTIVRAEAGREPSSDILYQMALLAGQNEHLDLCKVLNDRVIADTGRTGLRLLPDAHMSLREAMATLASAPIDKLAGLCSDRSDEDKRVIVALVQAITQALKKMDEAKEIIASLDALTPIVQRERLTAGDKS